MKGMTLDFAVTRVFELESKKEFIVNRMMIDNYLTSLKKGLEKNQKDYVEMHTAKASTTDEARLRLLDQQRQLRLELPRVAYRQFEVRGYDKMIERILEAPIRSSQSSNNKELEEKLMLIKGQLKEQAKQNSDKYETAGSSERVEIGNEEERKQTDMDKYVSEGEESSYESYYDEEEDEEAKENKSEGDIQIENHTAEPTAQ